jgi:hypothetical protein
LFTSFLWEIFNRSRTTYVPMRQQTLYQVPQRDSEITLLKFLAVEEKNLV